jgi:AraC-like DNA-binding protein
LTLSANAREASVARLFVLAGYPSHVDFRDAHRNRLHRHSFFEPSLVVRGRGEFVHDGQRVALQPGDLFLADVGVPHEISSLRTHDLELAYTTFVIARGPADVTSSATEDTVLRAFLAAHTNHVSGQHALNHIFEAAVAQEHDNAAPMRSVFAADLMRTLVLNIAARLTMQTPPEPRGGIGAAHVSRALDVIEARIGGPLTVPEVATEVGISERSLGRLFAKEVGRSVGREIQLRRIQRAAALLAMPEMSVAEAGRRVGIADPTQFSRLFRRVVGISPRAYRLKRPQHVVRPAEPGHDVPMQTQFL